MSTKTRQILPDSIAPSPIERAAIAEKLLSSLDRPVPQIDALWIAEAELTLSAYDAGQMEAISADEMFAEPDNQ